MSSVEEELRVTSDEDLVLLRSAPKKARVEGMGTVSRMSTALLLSQDGSDDVWMDDNTMDGCDEYSEEEAKMFAVVEVVVDSDESQGASPMIQSAAVQQQPVDPFWVIAQLPGRTYFHGQMMQILQSRGHPLPPRMPLARDRSSHLRGTLVLDLDETLVHSSVLPMTSPDYTFDVDGGGSPCKVYAKKRPWCDEFLRRASQMFEIVIFTASKSQYAGKLLDLMDGVTKHIHHRVYRDHCYEYRGTYIKDLHLLGRDLEKTVIVDNSPHCFALCLDNGIPIESWYDDPKDDQLCRLLAFLERLVHHSSDDFRPALRSHFKLSQRVSQYPR